ncbi:LIC_12708 family protein [Breznakiella homolactica]|uniref:Lipoprotein n=1 Tax=Breznakiella homolactica TaxID=2798577 RepID=A0A7T8B7Z8_9SPIR|nr:hypothetical protein [Breznakiella homolactica]QQO08059.1 hypothetical protein JFL75_14060 [Breznakiella homolactica]
MRRFFVIALFSAAVLGACSRINVQSIDREDLFTIDIGRLEDQIDLYNLEGNRSIRKTRITMRDGLFYISDGNGEKIVRYTSYGDLLFMIYNEETNPPPMTLRTNVNDQELVTRWAFSYPLREPGEISVDSRKHIYVEDRLPAERHGFDSETRALLDSTVLHFDADGRFVEYLGQEGIGGSPFPRINGIFTSYRDDLAVVCRLPVGWNIYWFDAQGALVYLIPILNEQIPVPPDREVWPSLDSISVAPDERKLYLKVDYYRDTYDESTNTKTGSVMDSSIIWILNADDGSVADTIEIPFYERTFTENNRRVTEEVTYAMLGVIQGGRVLLSVPVEGGYAMLVLRSGSPDQRRGFIRVDNEELQFNDFSVSEDGILSGLLATDWDAKVVWWRSDVLLGEFLQ